MIRATSIEAFHTLKNKKTKRTQVLDALGSLSVACNLDIAYKLQWPINRVTPRMNELVKDGLVVEDHRAVTPRTGKRVIFWRVNDKEQS